ncbi:hypothetical protein C9E88_011935 [Acinetobacter cumulans]|uniref:hypothetical protein n=1 Tax=Acinetobacter TaxID=469 RepID=UPI000D133FB7|nr:MULTISPECIES: hypothetical protein [Acinetobacter]QCO22137.1 hypothetical protein C9E88_011935 [Acinetobacter cumulans]RKG46885.1 hypothetical protein D7V51_01555 [Acinetobacter cumulans]RZG62280.1 hypothetical protein EXE29_01550 [Acinetobacter sp. WCHAc060006]
MDYFFTIESELRDINITQAKQKFKSPAFHEDICQRIPCTELDIQLSEISGQNYRLERAYNLDLDIPDIIRKLLKGAFRLQRNDLWDLEKLSSESSLKANLPGIVTFKTKLLEAQNNIKIQQEWKLDISVPLIHKVIAKFAETEIRKFHAIEVGIIQKQLSI